MDTKQPQLINSHGRASAVLIDQNASSLSSILIDHDGDLAITSSTIQSHEIANEIKKPFIESRVMVAFDESNRNRSSQYASQSALVPFDVPNMGRMAIHKSEVLQIQGMTETNLQSSDAQSSTSSSGSSGSNTSAGLSVESISSNHTISTIVEDPSFDASMHSFLTDPHSDNELTKEILSSSLASSSKQQQSSSLMNILREATANLPKNAKRSNGSAPFLFKIESTPSNEACKPRLNGMRMPTLDWPDAVDGPWSAASEQLTHQHAKKRRAIQRWLEEESDEDIPTDIKTVQQHPMIAKVIIDRKRQEDVIRSIASSQASTFTTPKKGKRNSKNSIRNSSSSSSKPSKRKLAKLRRSKVQTPSSLRNHYIPDSALATPRRKAASINAQIGCQCGRTDDGTPMVQCDGCNMWYHMGCIGLTDSSALNEDEWICVVCCEVATSTLTPSSTLSGGLMVTPSFPRSAALAGQQIRLSQGQLPVFYQSDDTPMHIRRDVSSALALAPSPVVPSSAMTGDRGSIIAAGRARASRVGWHFAEPGSPLERKSGTINIGAPTTHLHHKRNLSGGMNPFMNMSPKNRQTRTFPHAHSDGDLCGNLASSNGEASTMASYMRTPSPSPRMISTTTSHHRQRQRSGFGHNNLNQSSADSISNPMTFNGSSKRSHLRMESNNVQRDSDDVFSTPSRMLQETSSWGMMRHNREDSFASIHGGTIAGISTNSGTPWGLSTPTRHMIDAGFNSDYSAGATNGMPSLIHSSGGLDLDEMSNWHTLQNSPTSHTRAVTRRSGQTSLHSRRDSSNGGNDLYSSSLRALTPERGFEFDIGSSSPFPKTPTFSSDPYSHLQNSSVTPTASSRITSNNKFNSFSRTLNGLSPISSPTTSHSRSGRIAKSRLGSLGGSGNSGANEILNGNGGGNKNGRDALTALQGPVEIRSSSNNSQQIKSGNNSNPNNQTRIRTRDSTTEIMAGLGIGFDLNEEVDWS